VGLGTVEISDLQRTRFAACVAAYITCSDWFGDMGDRRDFRLEGSELVALADDLLGTVCLSTDCKRLRVFGLFPLEVWHLFDRHILSAEWKILRLF